MIVKRGNGEFPRIYRPCRMSEVYGQESIVKTITHGLDNGDLPNALLFLNPTDSGTTTISRIIGMGLLCEKGPTSSPCCECKTCKSIITGGEDLGYREYSGYELRAKKNFLGLYHQFGFVPEHRKRKIVVINECDALNAERKLQFGSLLPRKKADHYVILCSRKPELIGDDLRALCTTFEFEKLKPSELEKLLYDVCAIEKMKIKKEIIDSIITQANSSVRQSLILLKEPTFVERGRALKPKKRPKKVKTNQQPR